MFLSCLITSGLIGSSISYYNGSDYRGNLAGPNRTQWAIICGLGAGLVAGSILALNYGVSHLLTKITISIN